MKDSALNAQRSAVKNVGIKETVLIVSMTGRLVLLMDNVCVTIGIKNQTAKDIAIIVMQQDVDLVRAPIIGCAILALMKMLKTLMEHVYVQKDNIS